MISIKTFHLGWLVVLTCVGLFCGGGGAPVLPQPPEQPIKVELPNADSCPGHFRVLEPDTKWEKGRQVERGNIQLAEKEFLAFSAASTFSDGNMKHLISLARLRWVILNSCNQITDQSLLEVPKMPELELLSLVQCSRLTNDGFAKVQLSECKSLRYLDVTSTKIGSALAKVILLPRIETIVAPNCTAVKDDALVGSQSTTVSILDLRSTGITDEALLAISGYTKLTQLNIANCIKLTDVGIAALKRAKLLSSLDICNTPNTSDDGLSPLAGLQHLKYLDCSECPKVTGSWISKFESLSRLGFLGLSRTAIDDKALTAVSSAAELEMLDVSKCKGLTKSGILGLGTFKKLLILNISETVGLSEAELEMLRSKLPTECEVIY